MFIFLSIVGLIFLLPFILFYFSFVFPPTRKLVGMFIKNKLQKMQQNGHVYYRSYHFQTGNGPTQSERDVTDSQAVIDVKPISSSHQDVHTS